MVVGSSGIWTRVFREHAGELGILLALNLVVLLAYRYLHWHWLSISTVPITIVGAALSVLLAFRSNEAYNRYNEARTLWGAIVNASRSLTHQMLTLLSVSPSQQERCLQTETIRHQIAYVHALRMQLWRKSPFDEIAPFLAASVIDQLRSERNVADAIMHRIARYVQIALTEQWLDVRHAEIIYRVLGDLTNAQGGCERIKNTPIPRSYTYVSHAIVIGFAFALPFGLVEILGPVMPVAALFICFVFLMIDRFAHSIEDPFCTTYSGLPLLSITRTIEINLRQRLGEVELPPDVQPVNGILP